MDGPIPWDKVQLYADRKGLEPDVFELLWEVIQELDYTERKWSEDNRPRRTPREEDASG